MADLKCKPKLMVGNGCIKLKAKSSVHWKILPSKITHSNKPWIIVSRSSDDGKVEVYEFFAVDTEESASRQVVGSGRIFFYGFELFRDDESSSNTRDVCFVKTENSASNEFYEYHVDEHAFDLRYYTFDFDCDRNKVPSGNLTVHKIMNNENECELAPCSREGAGGNIPPETTIIPSASEATLSNTESPETPITEAPESSDENFIEEAKTQGKASGDVEDVNDNVNRQLLIYAVEMAFPHFTGPTDSMMTGPKNSWILLERLFELAKQTCHMMVTPTFLSRVLKYFKIAHFGEHYGYEEYFSEMEMKQILSMLDTCQERADRYREMEVEVDSCTGKAARVTLENKTGEIISRSTDDTGYQAVFHHHVIEATWNVIDLWSAVCINEFKTSYLLYHHMEKGLETLFTDKLRKLWHFPNVTEGYFQKLLGPDEGIQLLNLDQCVLAAYKGNMRINRMGRPNHGSNTIVGKMIRNRLDDEKLKKKGIPRMKNVVIVSNISTACIRGPMIKCRTKPSKLKKSVALAMSLFKSK